ncbi:hypothetical protein C0Q70_10138 [Pomacea canaliculata]|uniref:Uncharacterized protein n=1 Tax=Pomacea canaliculata TaxID=400727 RepID=A0A2T7PBR4_POMCA|nr:hypothetical protein C0Q70_10138 [Pomacea canaliculata]
MFIITYSDLVDEGRLNPAMLPRDEEGDDNETTSIEKRMQYMGICMRRRQNTLIPYPCLRSG